MAKRFKWLQDLIGYPAVTAIEAATLAPGDLIVVHVPLGTSHEEVVAVRDELMYRLPPTVNCCLMVGDIRIDVVRVVDPVSRPMQRPIGG